MLTIWKFQLAANHGEQDVEMPKGAKILLLAPPSESALPCVWALVDPAAPKVKRRFITHWTGDGMPENSDTGGKPVDLVKFPIHVATYFSSNGGMVWHVFTDGVER